MWYVTVLWYMILNFFTTKNYLAPKRTEIFFATHFNLCHKITNQNLWTCFGLVQNEEKSDLAANQSFTEIDCYHIFSKFVLKLLSSRRVGFRNLVMVASKKRRKRKRKRKSMFRT